MGEASVRVRLLLVEGGATHKPDARMTLLWVVAGFAVATLAVFGLVAVLAFILPPAWIGLNFCRRAARKGQ
jgi:hypothetical protein